MEISEKPSHSGGCTHFRAIGLSDCVSAPAAALTEANGWPVRSARNCVNWGVSSNESTCETESLSTGRRGLQRKIGCV